MKILIPKELQNLPGFLESLVRMRKELSEKDFNERLNEVIRVDEHQRDGVKQGCEDWFSETVRDKYFISIMEGKISIGS